MTSRKLVNIAPGSDFMSDGIKPLLETMLTYHQRRCMAFIENQLHK